MSAFVRACGDQSTRPAHAEHLRTDRGHGHVKVGELLPGKPVTIGRPLPTYSITLDDQLSPVPDGEVREICLGDPG